MNDEELAGLLGDLESDRVERKSALTDKDRVCQAICAFANDLPNHGRPGVVFIGVEDDGRCSGLPITDQLLQTLADLRSNGNILPFPLMIVQKRLVSGCELAAVVVQPSDAPPVRYRGQVWVRVGSRRATATAEEERRLAEKRRYRDLPHDLHPIAAASRADLDLLLFERLYLPSAVAPEVLAENQRSIADQLASLRFTTPPPDYTPTVLGMLCTGSDPLRFVPGAYVQFVRFNGPLVTDPIQDSKEIVGPLPDLVGRLDEVFEAHVSTASDLTSASVEAQLPDYPLVALQQLSRNAILHRNYETSNAPVRIAWHSDRIEILSPGGLYGQVTRETFGRPGVTDYRNPNLAGAMRDLGYVQRFGVGIELAREHLRRNGNPPPEFLIEDAYLLAILRKAP